MKVIKNSNTYSITLSDQEVNNILLVCDLSPMIGCFDEIRDILWKAKKRELDIPLKNWNYIPASYENENSNS